LVVTAEAIIVGRQISIGVH